MIIQYRSDPTHTNNPVVLQATVGHWTIEKTTSAYYLNMDKQEWVYVFSTDGQTNQQLTLSTCMFYHTCKAKGWVLFFSQACTYAHTVLAIYAWMGHQRRISMCRITVV